MDFLLTTKGLTKTYGKKTALNNFDINIPKSTIYGLLGPNGAGKTTFIRIINQITAPDSGTIHLNGKPLDKNSISHVGYMPEERGLYKNMKVGEQALYFARLKGLSSQEAKKKTRDWFDKLDISQWWDKKLSELSKGMGQKVQFVITVLHEPDLLIFDEPFSGFDPVNAKIIANEIIELKEKGTTIIFSTHRMESVEEMCDYVALINQSNKVLDGTIEDVRNQFKSGKYFVKLKINEPEKFQSIENQFHLENIISDAHHTQFELIINSSTHPNTVISELIQAGDIVTFNEAIPSMNDIFIEAVRKSNEN